MRLPKVKKGDIFELHTNNGIAYFQCVKESPATEVETIRILPGIYVSLEQARLEDLVNKQETFFIKFPLKYGLKKKVIKFVGNYRIPNSVIVPRYYRDMHIVRGEFIAWHIIDSETYMIQSVKELSEEQKKLSPAGMWNDTLLAERIAEGWTLENWI